MSSKNYLGVKQDKTHKVSGRRQQDFQKAEEDFQVAQAQWNIDINNKDAWDKMWFLIQTAVFNNLNKDLCYKLDKEEIEERAIDITINIMRSIRNKRDAGKSWMIKKVSSFVHLPCLAKYDKKLQFWDKVMSEDAYVYVDEDGNQRIIETPDSQSIDGVMCLSGSFVLPNYIEKVGTSNIDQSGRFDIVKYESEEDE